MLSLVFNVSHDTKGCTKMSWHIDCIVPTTVCKLDFLNVSNAIKYALRTPYNIICALFTSIRKLKLSSIYVPVGLLVYIDQQDYDFKIYQNIRNSKQITFSSPLTSPLKAQKCCLKY